MNIYLLPIGTGPSCAWAADFLRSYLHVERACHELAEKRGIVAGSTQGTITTGPDAEVSIRPYAVYIGDLAPELFEMEEARGWK